MSEHESHTDEAPGWFDKPENGRKIHNVLAWICAGLVVADFLVSAGFLYHPHFYFPIEHVVGFYGAAGFGSYVLLVILAKLLRKVVKRDERYYEPEYQARQKELRHD